METLTAEQVILVDDQDQPLGTMEKMAAHQQGLLHRAFSVFVFNSRGEMLLQRRALSKYHSGGLWTNTCCSHPRPGEAVADAALRRLQEEMGFTTPLQKVFDFVYRASFHNGLVEHEFDHVFVGAYEGVMQLNPEEVMEAAYWPVDEIGRRLKASPDEFTEWFALAFPGIEAWWQKNYASV